MLDILKFHNPTHPVRMQSGEIVNGLKSKMWIERYLKEGEFTLVGDAHSNLRDILPIGTFISHTNTPEVMIVENHEIKGKKGESSEITVTGRSFETLMEQRVIGCDRTFPTTTGNRGYYVITETPWQQMVTVIDGHIGLLAGDDRILNVHIDEDVPQLSPIIPAHRYPLGNLYEIILKAAAARKIGIKVLRPGTWKHPNANSSEISIVLHRGSYKGHLVSFSFDAGEVESADYFWSSRQDKNVAIVHGKWVSVRVGDAGLEPEDVRQVYVDGSSVDNVFSAAPTGTDLTEVIDDMTKLGEDALEGAANVALVQADVNQAGTSWIYRQDYMLGDIVSVVGDYNEVMIKNVVEHVEIEDAQGFRAYPTFDTLEFET